MPTRNRRLSTRTRRALGELSELTGIPVEELERRARQLLLDPEAVKELIRARRLIRQLEAASHGHQMPVAPTQDCRGI